MAHSRASRTRPGHIYVLSFSDKTIKIGASGDVGTRMGVVIGQHRRMRHVECVAHWVRGPYVNPWQAERLALEWARAHSTPTWDNETFSDLDWCALIPWIKRNCRLAD